MSEWPGFDSEEWLRAALANGEVTAGERSRGYALPEFVCPGCGGTADIQVAEVAVGSPEAAAFRPLRPPAQCAWYDPWQAYVTIELVCQGPSHLDAAAPDAWDHAGEAIDLIATGYQPLRLT